MASTFEDGSKWKAKLEELISSVSPFQYPCPWSSNSCSRIHTFPSKANRLPVWSGLSRRMLGTPSALSTGWGGDGLQNKRGRVGGTEGRGPPGWGRWQSCFVRTGPHCLITDTEALCQPCLACLFPDSPPQWGSGEPRAANTPPPPLAVVPSIERAASQTPPPTGLCGISWGSRGGSETWCLLLEGACQASPAGEWIPLQRRLELSPEETCLSPSCGACYLYQLGLCALLLLLLLLAALCTEDLSSQTRDRTHVPALGARNLNHWTTREVPGPVFSSILLADSARLFCPRDSPGRDTFPSTPDHIAFY